MNIDELKFLSNQVRKDIVNMIYNAKSGHPAGALGLADIFTYLYFNVVDVSLIKKNSPKRDFIFLSNGHTCAVLYSILARVGILKQKDLLSFRKLGSILQGHPHYGLIKGVENSGGPLGQGVSQAVGLASSLKRDGKKNRVFCFLGDGELEEGEVWEAFLYASKERLNNLVVIVDKNNIQIDGDPKDVGGIVNLHKKIESFGFVVVEFDGNDFNQIASAFKSLDVCFKKEKPICFISKNIAGCGISFIENDYHWHGKSFSDDEYKRAIEELNKKDIIFRKERR